MKVTTLCFLVRENEVLLAMKKRGFGAGKFNGVGGKVEVGESVVSAAIREAEEEIGVRIAEPEAKPRARLHFIFEGRSEWDQDCHVFVAERWQNDPLETEEMKPEWFPIDALPFEKMWVDDSLWLPKVLAGKCLEATFQFDSEGTILKSHTLKETASG